MSKYPTEKAIKECIIKALAELQGLLGKNEEITDNTCPSEDLKFDSHILVTATGLISHDIGFDIPNDCHLFSDKKNNKKLTVIEAAAKLIEIIKANGK